MIDPFYLAAIPEPRTILGLKLRPLSLGHIILLHRVESYYVCGGAIGFDDLSLSVLICASTYEEGLDHLNNPDLAEQMRLWAERLTGMDRWPVRWGLRKPTPIDFESKHKAFADYISEGSRIPNYHFNPGDFTEISCPNVQLVKAGLMRDMHFTESAILNRSWAMCLWDHVTLKAMAGTVKMHKQDEIEDAQKIANELAERIKKGEVKIPCQS